MEQARISSSSSQNTQPAHAVRGKPAAQGTDTRETGGAMAGGFLALLSALGEEGQEGDLPLELMAPTTESGSGLPADEAGLPLELMAPTTESGSGLPADEAGDNTATLDVSAIAAWQGFLLAGGAAPLADGTPAQEGLAAEATQTGVPEAGMAISHHQTSSAPDKGIVQDANATNAGAVVTEERIPQGLVAETTMLDTSADLKSGSVPGATSSYGRVVSRLQNALVQRAEGVQNSRNLLGQGEAIHLQVSYGAALVSQMPGERAPASLSAGIVDRGAGGQARSPGSDLSAAMDNLPGFAESVLRGESSSGGSRLGEGGSSGPGVWSDGAVAEAPLEPGSADAAAVFADPTQAGAEEQVANRVAYWVHQKTQNAELTLNRDGQPVEVSVSLSGNEAHVSFRSDQAQTRELLDQSMAQLRELLRGEGLVLSGMSVGTSAGNGAGAGNADSQRPRDGARQAQVVSAAPSGSGSMLRGGASADRAVDIFV